ncbi:hypothetical protein [Rhizobium sp. L1K21]|uniref:hypothetical protein n=1 Tax=Rhizobium sp. L1K21 TaxID=2954933 RepID=UPI002091F3FD|nr:hypothetical protein [Rhizobium sp. L1K21]MCO6185213.1 hypothetical protein [Rhizobium sp. L1K21]
MSLRLTEDAASFFSKIDSQPIKGVRFLDIDKFYACLMLGFRYAQLASDPSLMPAFLAAGAKYPDAYQPYDSYLLGLLVEAEIRRRNLDPKNRDLIEQETVKLLDPHSPLGLSEDGIRFMNRYAAKGFEILRDAMAPPRSVDDFLVAYADLWQAKSEPDSGQPA